MSVEHLEDEGDAHRFGGIWTLLKLETLERYLTAYTTALSRQPFDLLYIDAFAGSGRCDVTDGDDVIATDGSAVRALRTEPPFTKLIFIEQNPHHVAALERLKADTAHRSIEVIQGDANDVLSRICRSGNWRKNRAVVFLDPFGMKVDWATLAAVADTRAIDVWYLTPLSGILRQAARDPRGLDEAKTSRLTRMLGTIAWRSDWYRQKPQGSLFGDEGEERHFDHTAITKWVTKRLSELFPGIEGPRIFYTIREGREHSPLYALYFLVSNPSERARSLACKMARYILEKT